MVLIVSIQKLSVKAITLFDSNHSTRETTVEASWLTKKTVTEVHWAPWFRSSEHSLCPGGCHGVMGLTHSGLQSYGIKHFPLQIQCHK